jgi:hypothetical protein
MIDETGEPKDSEILVRTPMGTDSWRAWDIEERDGHMLIHSRGEGLIAVYAPGQWLRVERLGNYKPSINAAIFGEMRKKYGGSDA